METREITDKILSLLESEKQSADEYFSINASEETYYEIIKSLKSYKQKGLKQEVAKEIISSLLMNTEIQNNPIKEDVLLSIYYIVSGFCSPKDDIW